MIRILLLGLLWSHGVLAFTLNSSSNSDLQGWADSNVRLMVNASNCPASLDVPGIITAAAEIWNNVPTSSVKVTYGGSTTSTVSASPTTVYCETNFQTLTGADQNFVPAAAAVSTSTGRITRGLLVLNVSAGTANIAAYDSTALRIILAHEIGHILGLGHSQSDFALMWYSASGRIASNLSQDDIDGITYLYPVNETRDGNFAGCGTITNLKPPTGGQRLILLLLLGLPCLVYWSLRRRSLTKSPFNLTL